MSKPLSPLQLLEAQVTKQIKDFMEWRGWRAVRMMRTIIPGAFETGEPGIPDYFFVRYLRTDFAGLTVTCWIEMKRQRGGKMGDDQIKWRDKERKRGAIVIKARDLREFEIEYERLFGWLRSEPWVDGQQQITFDNSVTNDLQQLTKSLKSAGGTELA